MAEEPWIEQTQNTLGKLISKPRMTDKYLKKPPFRFLHDIVMEVTRATSFGQGLFSTEESDAASLADKQAKVDFLNKAIDVVSFSLNEKVDVSAGKIVAGLEADKTNAWLQKLYEAATTCVGAKSDEAVARIQAGETSAPAKEKAKKKKDAEPPPPEASALPPADPDAAAAAEDEAKKEEDRRRRAEKKKRDEEKRRKAEEEAAAAKAAEEAALAAPEQTAPSPAEDEEELKRKQQEQKEQERKKRDEEKRRRQEKQQRQAEEEERRRQAEEAAMAAAPPMAEIMPGEDPQAQGMQGFPEQPPSAPGSAAQPTRPAPGEVAQPASTEEIAARAEALLASQQQGGEEEGMGMGRAQRSERPRTAGRKPPKVVSKVQTSSDAPVTQGPAAPTILAEGVGHDDDEDTFEAPQEVAVVAGGNLGVTDDGGQQGKLVRDLEAQKKKAEEQERERIKQEEENSREEFDDQQGKGIKMGKLKRKAQQGGVGNEVDTIKLGESIQQLCQAANPLGKSIDLVHQDIANMGKELDHWKQEYRDASERYQHELKSTDEILQPLYQKVAELDDKIAEQKTRIRNSRSRISKNDLKIQGLLESVVLAK